MALILEDANAANHEKLQAKVLVRRAKLLLLLYADNPSYAERARSALGQLKDSPAQQLALDRFDAARAKGDLINRRLASMPRYRHVIKPELE